MTSDEHIPELAPAELVPIDELTIIPNADGSPAFAVLQFAAYRRLIGLLQEMRDRLDDIEDRAWARDYEQRKAAGTLTADERETIPIDDLIAELAPGWTDKA